MVFDLTFYFCYMFPHHSFLLLQREMLHEVVFRAFSEFRGGEIKSMASLNVLCVTRFLEYCHLS